MPASWLIVDAVAVEFCRFKLQGVCLGCCQPCAGSACDGNSINSCLFAAENLCSRGVLVLLSEGIGLVVTAGG